MEFIATLTTIGAVTSIIALFLPAQGWKVKIIHALYVLVIAVFAGLLIHYQHELTQIRRIENAANRILEEESMMTTEGFIHATLTFLEKNKNRFPDAYLRAQEICRLNQTFLSEDKIDGAVAGLQHAWSKLDVKAALRGILQGIVAVYDKP